MSYLIDFTPHNKKKVLEWLVMYMVDDQTKVTGSNLAAKVGDDYRWRINKKPHSKKVWFANQEDAQLFQMTWKN